MTGDEFVGRHNKRPSDTIDRTGALIASMEGRQVSYQNPIPQIALQNGLSRHAGLDKLDLPLYLTQISLVLRYTLSETINRISDSDYRICHLTCSLINVGKSRMHLPLHIGEACANSIKAGIHVTKQVSKPCIYSLITPGMLFEQIIKAGIHVTKQISKSCIYSLITPGLLFEQIIKALI